MSDKPPLEIRHVGALTLSSLGNALPTGLFRPTSRTSWQEGDEPDPHHLGWECVPSERKFRLLLKDLGFATAEGLATLATVVDCLRSKTRGSVEIEIDSRRGWASTLGIEQIQNDTWAAPLSDDFRSIHGSHIYPVWRVDLSDREVCGQISSRISQSVDRLPQEFLGEFREEILASLELVARESSLNVFEHAYRVSEKRLVFGALTVSPVPRRDQLGPLAYASPEELDWFDANYKAGLMLELTISDFGFSVPFTLWPDFKRNHADVFTSLSRYGLGTREGQSARAQLHQQITLWAFNHMSSRKGSKDFFEEHARYNWRGLSRALNSASRLNACIVVRSGQARSGYAFQDHLGRVLTIESQMHREFPGTALVLRFPLPPPAPRRLANRARAYRALRVDDLVTQDRIGEVEPSTGASVEASMSAVVYPFYNLKDTDVKKVLDRMRSAPPQKIVLNLFCYPDSFVSLDELRVFSIDILDLDQGVPRLTGFWAPDQRILWKFVGALPESVRRLIEQLELTGVAYFDEGGPENALATQLHRVYGSIFQVTQGTIRMTTFDSDLDPGTADDALSMAFDIWLLTGQEGWVFEDPDQVYRLPTGRLVRRFASVFKLLLSNDMLSQAVSLKLRHLLLANRPFRTKPVVLIAHSEASYFVARMLLKDKHVPTEVYVRKLPDLIPENTSIYVFADAVYKGETLSNLLRSVDVYQEIICVLDLRNKSMVSKIDKFISLLRYPFDSGEVSSEGGLEGRRELEVDAVTHIPEEGPRSERIRIGTSHERDLFVDDSAGILRYGIHWANARVHSVSLSVSSLLEHYQERVLVWLSEIVEKFVNNHSGMSEPLELVIFTRYEASVGRMVPELCRRLRGKYKGFVTRIFSVVLPFAPTEPREVFGRISGDLLTGIAEALPDRLQFTFEIPANFVALFLDDHCVTGNNLRNFLIKSMTSRAGHMPKAILAVPIVSRLGPGEEFFFSTLCSHLSSPSDNAIQVPFRFHCLFRLQVRSADTVQSTSAFNFLARCLSGGQLMNERMLRYLGDIKMSLESMPAGKVIRHPFYRGRSVGERSVSPRVVRIRHLIALHQQNVGVLGELLREGYRAFDDGDYGLLTLFAVEPVLLSTPAIHKAWGHDLAALAVGCLKASDHLGEKSDALTVLALTFEDIAARLVELLPFICVGRDLVDQLLVLLIVLSPKQGRWIDNLFVAIDRCGSLIESEHRVYLRACATSIAQLGGPVTITTEEDAEAAIVKFTGGLAFHGKWLQPLTSVNDWLSQRESERNGLDAEVVREKIKSAAFVIRDIVLPSVEGLRLISKVRGEISAASDLEDARVDVIHNLNYLTEFVDSIGSGPIGSYVAQSIEVLWGRIRERTFRTSPDLFLGTLRNDEPSGMFERIMQRMFSSPVDVVRRLVRLQLPGTEVVAVWERRDANPSIVLTPYSVEIVAEMGRLLLQDIIQHGVAGSAIISFALEDVSGRQILSGKFSNKVKANDAPRGGKSQARVHALAKECGLLVSFDEPRAEGDEYEVIVEFQGAVYISGE